jgi:hypothetical protein
MGKLFNTGLEWFLFSRAHNMNRFARMFWIPAYAGMTHFWLFFTSFQRRFPVIPAKILRHFREIFLSFPRRRESRKYPFKSKPL